ncbi:hypothetical protein AAC387_Pa12g1961 [Persea americana]
MPVRTARRMSRKERMWRRRPSADALAKMKPPQEIIFTDSLPIHIQAIYLQEICTLQEGQSLNRGTMNLGAAHMASSMQ